MSELDEKRAEKNGQITVNGLLKKLHDYNKHGNVTDVAMVFVEKSGQVNVAYTAGNLLEYMGLADVLKNDLLHEFMENQPDE